jgi:hypothetical protein
MTSSRWYSPLLSIIMARDVIDCTLNTPDNRWGNSRAGTRGRARWRRQCRNVRTTRANSSGSGLHTRHACSTSSTTNSSVVISTNSCRRNRRSAGGGGGGGGGVRRRRITGAGATARSGVAVLTGRLQCRNSGSSSTSSNTSSSCVITDSSRRRRSSSHTVARLLPRLPRAPTALSARAALYVGLTEYRQMLPA